MPNHMQPFFAALQEIIRAGEPAPKRPTCRWCGQPGGDNCCHCEPVEWGPEFDEDE